MKRKVIKQGNNTLTVTLPRKWTSKHSVQVGDELEVEEHGSSLYIGHNKERTLGEISVDIQGDHFFRRSIFIPYSKGYDIIRVNFKNKSIPELIKKNLQYMLGFELVDQGENYCVLKNIAKGIEEEFDTIFNRMALIAASMGEDMYDALSKNEIERLENIRDLEGLSNKFNLFCRRILNTRGYKDPIKTNSLYRLSCSFERIADNFRDICTIFLSEKLKAKDEILNFLSEVNKHTQLNYKLVQKFDLETMYKFKTEETGLKKDALNLLKKMKGSEALIVHHLLSIIEEGHDITEELF